MTKSDAPTLVVLESAEWTVADRERGWRPSIEYFFLVQGKSKPRDPAWMLRPDDQLFFKNTKYDNSHPVYQSAKNRIGTNPWFDFTVDETEINGVAGLLLTCTSTTPPKDKPKAKKPVEERKPITQAQWKDAMELCK